MDGLRVSAGASLRLPGRTHRPRIAVAAAAVLAAGCLAWPAVGLHVVTAVALVAGLVAAGSALFAATIAPPAARAALVPVVRWAAIAGAVASLLALPFFVVRVADAGWSGLGDDLARQVVADSGDLAAALVRGVALAVLAVAAASHPVRRDRQWVTAVAVVAVCASYLLSGHARIGTPAAVVIASGAAHLLAAAAWAGGLVGLGISLRALNDDPLAAGALLHRFARWMTVVLGALLAGGVGLAVCYLPSPAALLETAYGQVLLIKLAVLLGVLAVSTANHLRLVPVARTGNVKAVRVLRMNIAVEQVGLLCVLLVTEILTRQNPGG